MSTRHVTSWGVRWEGKILELFTKLFSKFSTSMGPGFCDGADVLSRGSGPARMARHVTSLSPVGSANFPHLVKRIMCLM